MSDNSWILRGVDPESRAAAIAEAERRGLSLADYLTQLLLNDGAEAEPAEPALDFDPMFAAAAALPRKLGLPPPH